MKMPKVSECSVASCAYNKSKQCHALAITIGDDIHPRCDTFCTCGDKAGEARSSQVGACKVAICKFNVNLECHAKSITVGSGSDEADCLTFCRK